MIQYVKKMSYGLSIKSEKSVIWKTSLGETGI